MAEVKPALITQTRLDNEEVRDAPVKLKRTVTYLIDFANASKVNLPYAVAVNGVVQPEFKTGTKKTCGKNGEIVVKNVDPGATVVLFLNSDAHPRYRKQPVYAVTPREHNVVVRVIEKKGKHSDTDLPIKKPSNSAGADLKVSVEEYTAALTGDIWMKISHKYTPSEIDELLPLGTSKVVRDCVKQIYEGLPRPSLEIVVSPEQNVSKPRTISIKFEDGTNPRENISSGYDLLKEGLTRVHPAGYAAVFAAAIEAQVNKVVMTSAWRPMLGSIAHRAGLGLDVNYVGEVRMNREALRKSATLGVNVTQEEQKLFSDFEAAKVQESAAKKEVNLANLEVRKAGSDSQKIIVAKQKLGNATRTMEATMAQRKIAEAKWSSERDKGEPENVKRFRASLLRCESVAQLFDPWFVDQNTRDDTAAVPNFQLDPNEKLHAHHLHITVYDPKIL